MRRVRPVPLYRQATPPSRTEGAGRPRGRRRPRGRPRGRVRGDRSSRARHAAARNDDRGRGRGRIDGDRGAGRRGPRGCRAPGSPDPPRRAGRRSRRDERPRASRNTACRRRRRRGRPRRVAHAGARPRRAPARQAGGARLSPRPGSGSHARRPARRPVRRPVARRPGRCRGEVDPRRRGASRDRRRPEGPAPVLAHASDAGPTPNRDRPPRRVVGGGRPRPRAVSRGSSTVRDASGSATQTRRSRGSGSDCSSVPSPRTAVSRCRSIRRASARLCVSSSGASRSRLGTQRSRWERPASASSPRGPAGRWTSSGSGARSCRTWRPRSISRGSHPRRPH